MSPRQKLEDWIKELCQDRLVRISGEPYLYHLQFVGGFVQEASPLGYEMGLCHDLLEDTGLNQKQLRQKLLELGYAEKDAKIIAGVVQELTSVYTKRLFDNLSKKERHLLEDQRLSACSAAAQTVKFGDIVYNARWTAVNEPKKLKKYLARKIRLLRKLNQGDPGLQQKAIAELQKLSSR